MEVFPALLFSIHTPAQPYRSATVGNIHLLKLNAYLEQRKIGVISDVNEWRGNLISMEDCSEVT